MKYRLLLAIPVLALFVGGAVAGPGQDDAGAQAEQALRQIEVEVASALLKGETAVLDRLWADEHTFTPPNGMVISKAGHLAMFKSGDLRYESLKLDEIKVRVYGDTATVSGRATVKGKVWDHEFDGQDRYLTVYVKRQGRWQQAASVAVRIAPPAAQAH
ncbi:MAG TPA: nuclear transport factor 2 family protein [Blastocatellia bacterium]|nr:nuclear transport factor 2 family protein [Blastocatellia bacterium]